VLTDLIRRLRGHAKAIKNSAARTMGQDMLAAAMVIKQQLLYLDAGDLVAAVPANEALAQMAKRFLYEDAVRFSNRHDGRAAMLGGINKRPTTCIGIQNWHARLSTSWRWTTHNAVRRPEAEQTLQNDPQNGLGCSTGNRGKSAVISIGWGTWINGVRVR
jgi:hypothetical protein